MSPSFTIGRHAIGDTHPTYFIADIAANHDGDLSRTKDLIHMAAEAGANAAKFQNFRAETIVSDKGFRDLTTQLSHQASWKKSVFQVYRDASLPVEWTPELKACCDEAGIDYFTTPYDLSLIDNLLSHVCAWKVGSGDITWHDMIDRLAATGIPLLLATGASTIEEVRAAVAVARHRARDIVLMQCNTNYTASVENFHHIALNVLKAYAREFPDTVLGLSDHTPGHATVLGAVALGARVIEKHFTDDCSRDGPDHKFSMDPRTWRDMVDRTRELQAALGTEEKRVMDNEAQTVVIQRRSIRATQSIPAGTTIESSMLAMLRPCPDDALPPCRVDEVLGRESARDLQAGDYIRPDDLR